MILESLNNRIIKALESGQVPWWGQYGTPLNVITRKPYSGFVQLLLNISAQNKSFQSRYWGTASEWRGMGAEIKHRPKNVELGLWGTEILTDLPRTVFNLDQIDGYFYNLRIDLPSADYEGADKLIIDSGAKIEYKPTLECYYWHPPQDKIVFPMRERVEKGPAGRVGFFHTMFHELAHFTQPRLNWVNSNQAIRELRAEMCADFLCTHFGLPLMSVYPFRDTHMKYMSKWIDLMRNDHNFIVKIANDAQEACDFLIGK